MPYAYTLIGLPGSGKSTFREVLKDVHPEITVISTDDMIEDYARAQSLRYTDVFAQMDIDALTEASIAQAARAPKDLVIDRTNLRAEGRARYLQVIAPSMTTVAVVFPVPRAMLDARLEQRARLTGKIIPGFVVDKMQASYEPPTGYDLIFVVDPVSREAQQVQHAPLSI